jgi:Circadian oscillating protein COP23
MRLLILSSQCLATRYLATRYLTTAALLTGLATYLGAMAPLHSQPSSGQPTLENSQPSPEMTATPSRGTFPNLEFACPTGDRIMVARKLTGEPLQVPIIRFTSMGKLSAIQRCQEVTARFNFLNTSSSANSLAYLTTGLRNNQPIVCSVAEYGAPCNQTAGIQVLTLHPRDRAPERRDYALSLVVSRLHNALAQTPVLLDSAPQVYVDMKALLDQAFAEAETENRVKQQELQKRVNQLPIPEL